ncbi:MAG TPA: hypothetical protein VM598_03790 [Bdellovibrionota bacterium]|nr:hypothetical protein [Bdellovibrionota bacterium]
MRSASILLLLAFAGCQAGPTTTASGGHDMGNAGDSAPIVFQAARKAARNRVSGLRACEFAPDPTASSTIEWIMRNRDALALDVLKSQHLWTEDKRGSCAHTATQPESPITFSYDNCRAHDLESAVGVLIHESVHHFGIPDEDFANAVAAEIAAVSASNCQPEEKDLLWLEERGEGSDWPVTVEAKVSFRDNQLCFELPWGKWPTTRFGGSGPGSFETIGNYWVAAYIGGKWVMGTYHWIIPGEACSHISFNRLTSMENTGWSPRKGELLGLMISTPARFDVRSAARERSTIKWVRWPYGD